MCVGEGGGGRVGVRGGVERVGVVTVRLCMCKLGIGECVCVCMCVGVGV